MLNLDTHVLLFAVIGALRRREKRLLSASRWRISAIVLWEIAKLADQLIAATSLVHAAPLVTRDARLLRSRRVPFPK